MYQNLPCCCFSLVSSLWLSTSPLVSLTSIASRSGQETLNLDSLKLSKDGDKETNVGIPVHWGLLQQGGWHQNQHLFYMSYDSMICLGCEGQCVYLVLPGRPGPAAHASRCSRDLAVVCLAPCFTTRWLLLRA